MNKQDENNPDSSKLHSAEYFGEERNYWWNPDFLDLMKRRWSLEKVDSLLDVGCGIGHWGQLLMQFTSPSTQLFGIDRETEWVKKAQERAKARGLVDRSQYRVGSIEQIPFADETFDLVTCQTILIHLKDIPAALKEMLRVLKKGGLLAVVEPNNLASSLVLSNIDFERPVDDILETVRFQMICERGKFNLGEGNNSAGELIPGYLSTLGLRDIRVFLSDKVSALIPPYDEPEQKTNIRQAEDWQAKDFWIWDRTDTARFFLAGGGSQDQFEYYWKKAMGHAAVGMKAVKEKTLSCAGGHLTYLVSGRK